MGIFSDIDLALSELDICSSSLSPQQAADIVLYRWQASRGDTSLTPEQRIEMAFYDYLLPPPILMSEVEYDAIERRLTEALQESC